MKLCAHTNSIISISVKTQMEILKSHGFDSVMLFWNADIEDTPRHAFPEMARSLGLSVENIHIPFSNEDALWLEGQTGDEIQARIIRCLEDCHRHGIPTAVMHPIGWKSKVALSQNGLDRFKTILETAEKLQVNLALENTSDTRALDYFFDHIPSGRLKFCYDNGHDHIFPQEDNCLVKYRNRLEAIHLTDNNGLEDQHLLPFQGKVDWSKVIQDLRTVDYQGPLAFEVGWQYRDKVKQYSHYDYIKELKKRADRILGLS